MLVYYLLLIIIASLSFVGAYILRDKRSKIAILCLITLGLILVVGLRYNVGTDYIRYAKNYSNYLNGGISLFSEPALNIVAKISSLIYDDSATWFFLMAVITMIPVALTICKHSKHAYLSVFMFVFLGCWHNSFNVIKQTAAMAILFAGYSFLRDRKFGHWVGIVMLAATFHISAVLIFPIYFIADQKINYKKILACFAIGGIIYLVSAHLPDFIAIIRTIRGGAGVSIRSPLLTKHVNLLRVLMNCLPILLCAVFYKLYDSENRDFRCLFNLSLVHTILNLAVSNSVYLTRFCIYTNCYNILFVPILLKPLNNRKHRFVVICVMILYFVFWSYDLYKGSTTVNFHWIFERQ